MVAGAFLISEGGETFDFPIGRNGDVLPVGIGGIGGGEIGNGGIGGQFTPDGGADAVIELEAPGAGHRQHGGIARPQTIHGHGHIAGTGTGAAKMLTGMDKAKIKKNQPEIFPRPDCNTDRLARRS